MNHREAQNMLDEAINGLLKASAAVHHAITKFPVEINRRAAPIALTKSPRLFIAYCALVRLLKRQYEFFAAETGVLIIRVPRGWPIDDFEYVGELCLKARERESHEINVFVHPSRGRKGDWDFSPANQLGAPKLVVFASQGAEVHPALLVSATIEIDLEILDDRHLDGLIKELRVGPLSEEDRAFLREHDPHYVDSIFRRGQSASAALMRLRAMLKTGRRTEKVLPMSAFGVAGDWGLQMVRDLQAWRDGQLSWDEIDKGILLYGPPGVGKTSFAKSLASVCNAHLVAASLAKWQAHGHLGDLLKAMRADFAEARGSAPAIMLLDEIDSFGDRRKFSGDNAHYCHEVVNALLEALDGLGGREGVVVVGATNFPQSLDPALVRAGRLERHIELSRPNQKERTAILEFYLPELVGAQAIQDAAQRLSGYTGADLEFLSRRARQTARKSQRAVLADDLHELLPHLVGLRDRDVWRVCVHEAGHAVAAKALGVGGVERVEIFEAGSADDTSDNGAFGRTWIEETANSIRTETLFRADIAMRLAGMAAEALIVGDRSTTSGGSRESDIAGASALALMMVTKFGMGRRLTMFADQIDLPESELVKRNPDLRADVDHLLDEEYARANQILIENQPALLSLAEALKMERCLKGDRLDALLSAVPAYSEDNTHATHRRQFV
ncbi:UNVERIFIED_ORG: DNA polymerase III delta prime subunit [Ensifer adhaerens]|nr:DNA polymerase III delta prime subunit [Ensifer adhaerens]